uniref:BZIP domain-containing protein n=1 Tax=Pygocentrus nattereri TaxID=42514 RepID=A0AAR2L5R4_PYGNA
PPHFTTSTASQLPRDPPERVCQRRQRNRDAARRSRKKQTERADVLHEVSTLETSNAAYVKEIAELKKELQHYTTILKEHEPHCTVQCLPGPSPYPGFNAQVFNKLSVMSLLYYSNVIT